MKCFSIYDCKADVYNVPFFSVSSGAVIVTGKQIGRAEV